MISFFPTYLINDHEPIFVPHSQLAGINFPTNEPKPNQLFEMRATSRLQLTNESLPSYNARTSAETLPGYALTDLNPPAKAHTHMTHTEDAGPVPTEDYVLAQPQLAFDAEANIARNNAPGVSIAHFHFLDLKISLWRSLPNTFARVMPLSSAAIARLGP
jgi:hypothetical protein